MEIRHIKVFYRSHILGREWFIEKFKITHIKVFIGLKTVKYLFFLVERREFLDISQGIPVTYTRITLN